MWCRTDHFFTAVFEVFNEMPAEELIEANRHARLSSSKLLLSDVVFIQFSHKKLFSLATLKNSQNLVTDGASKLGYSNMMFVDLGIKIDVTYYCDFLLS